MQLPSNGLGDQMFHHLNVDRELRRRRLSCAAGAFLCFHARSVHDISGGTTLKGRDDVQQQNGRLDVVRAGVGRWTRQWRTGAPLDV